jgi:hypothetical protein
MIASVKIAYPVRSRKSSTCKSAEKSSTQLHSFRCPTKPHIPACLVARRMATACVGGNTLSVPVFIKETSLLTGVEVTCACGLLRK